MSDWVLVALNAELDTGIAMYKVHGYLSGKRVINWRMQHLPRLGDEVRISDDKYGVVKQVVWCMDEDDKEGQRVNLRIEKLSVEVNDEY